MSVTWKLRIKSLLNDKFCIFWTQVFPILIGILICVSLPIHNENGTAKSIPIAVCIADKRDDEVAALLKNLKTSEEIPLFSVTECSQDKAGKMLAAQKIAGYVVIGAELKLFINDIGTKESILETVLNRYVQTKQAFYSIKKIYEKTDNEIVCNHILSSGQYIKSVGEASDLNRYGTYFFVLIGQACMFGAYWGIKVVSEMDGRNMLGMRRMCAPGQRWKKLVFDTAAAILIEEMELTIIIFILIKAGAMDIRMSQPLLFLSAYPAGFNGVLLGEVIAFWTRGDITAKNNIGTVITVICALLSGLIQMNVKYAVEQKFPLISWINPISVLYDAYYSVYYGQSVAQYCVKMAVIFIMSVFLVVFIVIGYRRRANEIF